MKLNRIENSLSDITIELEKVLIKREKLLKESRDVISFSAKAIMNVHLSNPKEAELLLKKVQSLLKKLKGQSINDLKKYLIQPETEYVEASVLYAIAYNKSMPSRKDLNVSNSAYILGILDVIGEVKRRIYDSIRNGKTKQASSLFSLMEKLYILLSPLIVYDNVIHGIKRKLDVARYSLEDVRSTITEEIRRAELIKTIGDIKRKVPTKE